MDKQDKVHNFAVECLLEAIREAGLYCLERGIQPTFDESVKLIDAIRAQFSENWKDNNAQAVSRSLLAEARGFGVKAVDTVWPKSRLN